MMLRNGIQKRMDVLLVEDDLPTRKLLERIISERGHQVFPCASAEEALVEMGLKVFPLVFLDINLPGIDGFELSRRIRSQPDGDRPYILVGTSHKEASKLREILDAGANDYLPKPYVRDLLQVRLMVAESQVKDIAARKEMEGELRFLALHDPLTRLPNRSQLEKAIRIAAGNATPDAPACVLYIDLDNFKTVNDTLGHDAGDLLLISVADILRESIRPGDLAVRHGGDEFAMILRRCGAAAAIERAEQILLKIGNIELPDHGPSEVKTGASIGVIEVSRPAPVEDILKRVDSACYAAKANGRNRVELFAGPREEGKVPVPVLPSADRIFALLGAESLQLYFQPIVAPASGELLCHEALLRLFPPGADAPARAAAFIQRISAAGLSYDVDRFVIQQSFDALRQFPDLHLSVNLHASSVCNLNLIDFIEQLFASHGVEPARLILEITETEPIPNFEQARTIMTRLKLLGCRFALDDFGAGFSPLRYLKTLPIDVLKIDGFFIHDLSEEPYNQAILRAIQEIARFAGIQTVAEKVENERELAAAVELGVDFIQGFLVAKPRPEPYTLAEITSRLRPEAVLK